MGVWSKYRFEPDPLVIDGVMYTGSVVHTATAANLAWDTGDISDGDARSVTCDTAGTYTYACTPHPWMLGQVVVT